LTWKQSVADFYQKLCIEIFKVDIAFENQVCCDWLATNNSLHELDGQEEHKVVSNVDGAWFVSFKCMI
jgi:hypothetical protein